MRWAEMLNRVASGWTTWAVAGIVEASILLGFVALVMLIAGKRLPAAAAHLALLVVLAKALLPIGIPVPRPELSNWFGRSAWLSGAEANVPTRVGEAAVAATHASPTTLRADARVVSPAEVHSAPVRMDAAVQLEAAVATSAGQGVTLAWQVYAMLGWLLVSFGLMVKVVYSQWKLRRALAHACVSSGGPIESLMIETVVSELSARLGVRRRIAVVVGPSDISPGIAGCWRPTLIVPRGLETRLSREQLEWVLLHELAHVRRGDLWTLLLVRVCQTAAWFNPAVWLASFGAEHSRECACDELALAHSLCSRGECGEAFLTLLAGASDRPGFAMEFLPHRRLRKYRLRRLVDDRPQAFAQRVLATTVAIGCVLTLGAVSFRSNPAVAAVQRVSLARTADQPSAEVTLPVGDSETEKHLSRIWERHDAPMKSGRVRLKVLKLDSLQKDPIQQGHDLADRVKPEVESLLDDLNLTDASCFRQLRDGLLAGNLILDHPSYRTLDLLWNETNQRVTWGDGETAISTRTCTFELDPAERKASITSNGGFWFLSDDWTKYRLNLPLRSTILEDLKDNRSPTSIHRTVGGDTSVGFRHDLSYFRTLLLRPDGTLRRATEQYENASVVREIDFQQYPGGVHLPRTRVRTYYPQLPGREEAIGPLQSLAITLIEHAEFNIDIPDSEFRMAVPANTAVWDRRGELKLRAAEKATDDVLTLFER